MNQTYITIAKDETTEQIIKKSRFICALHRVTNEEEAREIISTTKKMHTKANHNCYAFIVGETPEIHRSSDDGEPSGTAGVPILEVLKAQQVKNTLAIVTRYFGGTKLGTGGLLRAYAHATTSALTKAGLVQRRLEYTTTAFVDYSYLNQINYFFQSKQIKVISTDFSDKVALTIASDQLPMIKKELIELLNNNIQFEDGPRKYYEYPIEATNSR